MNFQTLYRGIVDKIGDDPKLLKLLEDKIANNKILARQFIVSEALNKKGIPLNEAEDLIGFSEKYVSKLDDSQVMAANRELAHFFNMDYSNLKKSTLEEAIEELMEYNTGGFTNLYPNYRKNLIEALTKHDDSKAALDEKTLSVIHEELSNSNLNLLESEMVNVVAQNNFPKLESKLKTISIISESLSLKDRTFIQECVKLIKENISTADLKESTYKTYDLYDSVINLLESNDLIAKLEDTNFSHIHNVERFMLKEANKCVVTFELHFNPINKTYKRLHEACGRLDKNVYYIGKKAFNNWDSIVLSENIKLDDTIICRGQVIVEGEDIATELYKLNDLFAKSFPDVLKSK